MIRTKPLLVSSLLASTALLGCATDSGPIEDCIGCDEPVPTITFDWGGPVDHGCPDLTPADREAAVIIEGIDADGLSADEQLIFDCEDGSSGVITLQDGDWDFQMEVVDQFTDLIGTIDPFDCFDSMTNGDDCLYYTSTPSVVENVDTFVDFDPDVDIVFGYGYARFDVDYQIDGVAPDVTQCGGFGADGADDFSVTMTLLDQNDGVLQDVFVCGSSPVITRDLPLGDYAPAFDLLDDTGAAINASPAVPTANDCPAGVCTLDRHLETFQLETVSVDEL